jgi:selenide,water dikinase
LGGLAGVHAMTDVTGFGLAGHLLEVCRGSALQVEVRLADLPLIGAAQRFARDGVVTGASARNWASYGDDITWPASAEAWQQALVSDPQTSGGLLVSCAPETAESVLGAFHEAGFAEAAVIGRMQALQAGARAGVCFG